MILLMNKKVYLTWFVFMLGGGGRGGALFLSLEISNFILGGLKGSGGLENKNNLITK